MSVIVNMIFSNKGRKSIEQQSGYLKSAMKPNFGCPNMDIADVYSILRLKIEFLKIEIDFFFGQ